MPLSPWLIASRPRTLTAAIIPVLVGTSLVLHEGSTIDRVIFVCALLGSIFIQIGTNFINDAVDFKKGTDTAERLGPTRVTQAGLLGADSVLRAGWAAFTIAALFGVPLIIRGGVPLLIVGVASILAGYFYTGGPYPLAYHGLGELFVILFFGLVAVGGSHYVQSGRVPLSVLPAGLSVGMLSTVILAINNLRDLRGDSESGKRTMAVRFGEKFARLEVILFTAVPFLLTLYWWREGPLAFLPWVTLPMAFIVCRHALRDSGRALNQALGRAAALHAFFGLLLTAGLLIDHQ